MATATKESTTVVFLTDRELILLDGKTTEKNQFEVDAAKSRLAAQERLSGLDPNVAAFVADVITEAKTNGELVFYYKQIRSCPVCQKSAGYAVRTRSSRRGWRGQPNYDRPLYLSGVELARRFVTTEGQVTVGACSDCYHAALPTIRKELEGIRAEISKHITGHEPLFKKHGNRECTKCGWTGHEGEMGKLDTLMGNGKYYGACPKCPAKNTLFDSGNIKTLQGFTIVDSPTK